MKNDNGLTLKLQKRQHLKFTIACTIISADILVAPLPNIFYPPSDQVGLCD